MERDKKRMIATTVQKRDGDDRAWQVVGGSGDREK